MVAVTLQLPTQSFESYSSRPFFIINIHTMSVLHRHGSSRDFLLHTVWVWLDLMPTVNSLTVFIKLNKVPAWKKKERDPHSSWHHGLGFEPATSRGNLAGERSAHYPPVTDAPQVLHADVHSSLNRHYIQHKTYQWSPLGGWGKRGYESQGTPDKNQNLAQVLRGIISNRRTIFQSSVSQSSGLSSASQDRGCEWVYLVYFLLAKLILSQALMIKQLGMPGCNQDASLTLTVFKEW